ncbi:MAG: 1-acyl-sn-glycerol-3-phosphate acyltransferase [bacterium]|nr:1-acyl-sn-glycerol-3-phosphate acyltransferase [bacterium]
MFIGGNKDKVIENIKKSVSKQEYNVKVEVDDPNLSEWEKQRTVNQFLKNSNTLRYKVCNICARAIIDTATRYLNRNTIIVGLEHLKGIQAGAIITSNHFNPLDNTVVRHTMKKASYKRMYIVSQDTNLEMKGMVGFLMRHADIIPLSNNKKYINETFAAIIHKHLRKKHSILIYPEQEMWFNYRKPRPPKRGAYYYAASNKVPIISCFVEIIDLPKEDTPEFYQTQYVMHVLPTIYPNPDLSVRENSIIMMKKDYEQKVEAYENAYGKKLSYDFDKKDIAGWICKE